MEQARYVGPNEHRLSAKNIRYAREANRSEVNIVTVDKLRVRRPKLSRARASDSPRYARQPG